MVVEGGSASRGGSRGGVPSTAELVDRLSRFDGPPEHFLLNLLAVQCHIAAASGGAILRSSPQGAAEVLAVYPPLPEGATAPVWLAQAVESAAAVQTDGATAVKPLRGPTDLYGAPATQWLVMVPLRGGGGVRGLAAFTIAAADAAVLEASRERLELTTSLLSFYEMRLTLQRRSLDLQRLRMAMETLAAVNEQDRFTAAGMAFANELASRWSCTRAGLGFLKGRYVHLKALSHSEKFSRKTKLVQDIEAAMEECLDQNLEVVHPSAPEAVCVARAAGELSSRHGPAVVASLPLRRGGEPIGVVTLERPPERPFGLEEMEALRLTCDLCTARLADLHQTDRWFGARLAGSIRKGLAAAVGPKHTWAKVAAIAVLAAAVFLVVARGDYQAEAPFAIEATRKQVVPAPFEGFLKSVAVRPGDRVAEGGALAELDASELRLKLAAAKAEQMGYLKQATSAMREATARRDPNKHAESQIAQASADALAEQIKVLEHRLAKAQVVSPIAGVVVSGDLQRQIGAPVKTGEVLFEVAQLESLRAELSVPEDQIADVRMGQRGRLATVSRPEERLDFVVEQINPVAEVVKQRNVFKVRVRLLEVDPVARHAWLRPGLEGVAKIDIDKRSYAWLWSRRLVQWVRMRFWW